MIPRLQILTLTLGFVAAGCESETRGLTDLVQPDAAVVLDAAVGGDGGWVPDSGVELACSGPSPAGCTENACPPEYICDPNLECKSSSCVCTPAGWSCTRDCGGGVCRPTELVFRFTFRSDVVGEQAYVQTIGGVEPWVSVFDDQGRNVSMDARCDICPCDQCGGCPVCGALPAATERVGTIERRWDLITHRLQRCPASPGSTLGCQEYEPLLAGHYVARFCYGYGVTMTPEGSIIEQPVCHDVLFDWPTTQTVIEHEVCDCG